MSTLCQNRGATEDGATCCRAHKLHVFPYFITIGDVLRHKLHSIITIGVALQILYFTVAVMLYHLAETLSNRRVRILISIKVTLEE